MLVGHIFLKAIENSEFTSRHLGFAWGSSWNVLRLTSLSFLHAVGSDIIAVSVPAQSTHTRGEVDYTAIIYIAFQSINRYCGVTHDA
ncbi:hypothetical protein M404DRAFT_797828 [Pisolithus tinctorius Marx 270]|uniref:Uncharacterized protein n=1 Tax=Pisolithus tinctorius Marx 270 TaxID=870435 RepID=A0A0C3PRS0_PISTI|nr:hypothetical protein M404DRAFT_797828 [Pisolithus tinctorius Marx 270]